MSVTRLVSASGSRGESSHPTVIVTQREPAGVKGPIDVLIGECVAKLNVDEALALAHRIDAAACGRLDRLLDFDNAP